MVAGSNEGPQRVQAHAAPVVDTPQVWQAKIKNVKLTEKDAQSWNTNSLGRRLAVDAACAGTAGGLVAPLITMIDK